MNGSKNTFDFNDSLKIVTKDIGKKISTNVHISHKLKIHVNDILEVVLTHYPLWNNETFLYMICNKHEKTILEKDIPESNVAEKVNTIINKKNFLN